MVISAADLSALFTFLDGYYEERQQHPAPEESCIPARGIHRCEEILEWKYPGLRKRVKVQACHWCGAASIGKDIIRIGAS